MQYVHQQFHPTHPTPTFVDSDHVKNTTPPPTPTPGSCILYTKDIQCKEYFTPQNWTILTKSKFVCFPNTVQGLYNHCEKKYLYSHKSEYITLVKGYTSSTHHIIPFSLLSHDVSPPTLHVARRRLFYIRDPSDVFTCLAHMVWIPVSTLAHIIKRKLYSQSVSQWTNKLYLSVVGENLALLLAGATTTVDITDFKKVILHN